MVKGYLGIKDTKPELETNPPVGPGIRHQGLDEMPQWLRREWEKHGGHSGDT